MGKSSLPSNNLLNLYSLIDQLARLVETSLLAREVLGSIPRLVNSGTVLPTARYRCDVTSELCYPDPEPRSLNPVTRCMLRYNEYREYNEVFFESFPVHGSVLGLMESNIVVVSMFKSNHS